MKKILKQTSIALSIALMATGFSVANDSGTVDVIKTEDVVKAQDIAVENEKAVVEKTVVEKSTKEVQKVKKATPKRNQVREVNMKSKGNYVAPLQNVSTNEFEQSIDAVYVEGLHVTPVVSIPGLQEPNSYNMPLDVNVSFPFKDAYGNMAPNASLVERSGKNLTVYHFNSEFKKLDVQKLNSFNENYTGTHKRSECDVIIYEYQMADDTEKAFEAVYLNKGRVADKQSKKGCKKIKKDKYETSQLDSNDYLVNVSFNKLVNVEGKTQSFYLNAFKDGKVASISDATAYIVSDKHNYVNVINGDGKTSSGSDVFFNDLKIPEGEYTFIVKYTIDGKVNQISFPTNVIK